MNTDIGALTTIFSEFYYWITIADVPDRQRIGNPFRYFNSSSRSSASR